MEYLLFFAAMAISFVTTYPTIWFARRFNLVTDRDKRKHPAHTHTGIIPRAGGTPIYIAVIICVLLFITLNKIIIGILVSSFLLLVVGLLDDYYDNSPYLRFVANILISALVVSYGLGIPYISNPLGGVIHLDQWRWQVTFLGHHNILYISDIIAVLWLTWIMNMVNWSKGVDGQLPGFVAITAFFLGLLSQRFTAHDISAVTVAQLCFIVSGAFLGFLPFNFFPQSIMPGYGGGALAGFLLGILSILSFGKVGTAILILAVPMIDAIYAIIRRLRHHQSPFKADWGHFHHRLLEIGWGKRRIAIFYWIVSFMFGISSLFLDGLKKGIGFLTVAFFIFVFFLLIDRMKQDRGL